MNPKSNKMNDFAIIMIKIIIFMEKAIIFALRWMHKIEAQTAKPLKK